MSNEDPKGQETPKNSKEREVFLARLKSMRDEVDALQTQMDDVEVIVIRLLAIEDPQTLKKESDNYRPRISDAFEAINTFLEDGSAFLEDPVLQSEFQDEDTAEMESLKQRVVAVIDHIKILDSNLETIAKRLPSEDP